MQSVTSKEREYERKRDRKNEREHEYEDDRARELQWSQNKEKSSRQNDDLEFHRRRQLSEEKPRNYGQNELNRDNTVIRSKSRGPKLRDNDFEDSRLQSCRVKLSDSDECYRKNKIIRRGNFSSGLYDLEDDPRQRSCGQFSNRSLKNDQPQSNDFRKHRLEPIRSYDHEHDQSHFFQHGLSDFRKR